MPQTRTNDATDRDKRCHSLVVRSERVCSPSSARAVGIDGPAMMVSVCSVFTHYVLSKSRRLRLGTSKRLLRLLQVSDLPTALTPVLPKRAVKLRNLPAQPSGASEIR